MTLSFEPTHVKTVAEKSLQLIESQVKGRDLKLILDIEQDIPEWLSVDATRLGQILINYLNNAQKFTLEGSITLKVSLCSTYSGNIIFSVIDTGPGIAQDLQPVLFDAFSQDDTDSEKAGMGTGLGLFISQRLARLMGGHVGFDSRVGEGTSFWVSLPLESCDAPSKIKISSDEVDDCLKDKMILVAEDNSVNQMVIKGLLKKLGCRFHVVDNGQEALDYVTAENEIDFILMDCEMPICDGFCATEKIRAFELSHRKVRLPIVALTAHALQGHKDRCYKSGMDAVLNKPIKSPELAKMMTSFLKGTIVKGG
jgi:CheY-like chemotaxis protein